MKLLTKEFLIVFIVFISSCGNSKPIQFDHKKWMIEQDLEIYPFRELMLKDILESKIFIGYNYNRLIDSLGLPVNYRPKENNEIYYLIKCDYGNDIDSVHEKYLKFVMDKDSIVVKSEVYEWRK